MTTKTKNKIIKNNNIKDNDLTYIDIIKSLFIYDIFTKKNISKIKLAIYSLVLLILIAIIATFTNKLNYSTLNNTTLFFGIIIGTPILFLLIYGLFYIFLNSFENKIKSFIESYLIVTCTTLPFILFGNILNYIGLAAHNLTLGILISYLLFIVMIYYLVMLIITIKKYYQTSAYKTITSIILVFIFYGIIILIEYLTLLINSLK